MQIDQQIQLSDLAEACEQEIENYIRETRPKRRRLPKGDLDYVNQLDAVERKHIRQSESRRREEGLDRLVKRLEVILAPLGTTVPDWWVFQRWFCIDLAYTHVTFAKRNYHETIRIIDAMINEKFPRRYHLEVENIWYDCTYALVNLEKSKKLNPVNRYRIRKRNPCPTAKIVGLRKYKITAMDKCIFEDCYSNNPKPNRRIKEELARKTGQPIETVSNWFKNKRQRNKYKARKASLQTINSEASVDRTQPVAERPLDELQKVAENLKGSQDDYMVIDPDMCLCTSHHLMSLDMIPMYTNQNELQYKRDPDCPEEMQYWVIQ